MIIEHNTNPFQKSLPKLKVWVAIQRSATLRKGGGTAESHWFAINNNERLFAGGGERGTDRTELQIWDTVGAINNNEVTHVT